MRIMVTGGAGFIGSHLVRRLVGDGHYAVVVDDFSAGTLGRLRPAIAAGLDPRAIHRMSVTDPDVADLVSMVKPEVIVHLAAQSKVTASMRDPRTDLHVNVVGAVNILEAARQHGVLRFVTSSSGGTIYGSRSEPVPVVAEDSPKEPSSFYGLSKHVADEYLRLYARHFGIEHVSLALGNVYGPGQDPHGECGVVAIFIDRLTRTQQCVLTGRGEAVRDYVHVSDTVEAFVRALERGSGLINVGTGVGTSVRQLYDLIASRIGVDLSPAFGPARPGEVSRVVLDPTLALRHLGWRPGIDLVDGVDQLLRVLGR